ncbi:hypothetical protein D9M70_524550 [compost metagenome]
MLVREGKGDIARHGDALPERPEPLDPRDRPVRKDRRSAADGIEVAVRLHAFGSSPDETFERPMLARLHEAEMALRQLQRTVLPQDTENRHAHPLQRIAQHHLVPVTADLVEDDANHPNIVAMVRITANECGDRMGQAGAIDNEDDGEIERRCEIGG